MAISSIVGLLCLELVVIVAIAVALHRYSARKIARSFELNLIGQRYLTAQLYEEALTHFKESVEINRKVSYFWENLGDAYVKMDQLQEAISSYKEALKLDPNNRELFNKTATIQKDVKKQKTEQVEDHV
ncbi:tetratricopeptide repeat protein [bacterium]|nr:tetratricopeptide repeat protein [bacterium]